jgi:hypothetical protein
LKNEKAFTLVELLIPIFGIGLLVAMVWWTGRSLDYALTAWKHHPVHVPYWLDTLVTLIGNGFTLVFNVVVEILRRVG